MQLNNPAFYLFGPYIIELAKFFKKFESYIVDHDEFLRERDDDGLKVPNPRYKKNHKLQVFYGTPREAYRQAYERFNGKIKTPMLNFYIPNWNRMKQRQPIIGRKIDAYNPTTEKFEISYKAPIQFEVTYSITLFTTNNTERDHILYQLYTHAGFENFSLQYKDTSEESKQWIGRKWIFMPFKFMEDFSDETELEGLAAQETRDIIRTSFTMMGESVVPFEPKEVNPVKAIYFKDESMEFYHSKPYVGQVVDTPYNTPISDILTHQLNVTYPPV